MSVSLERQVKCAGRELGIRRAVYPRFISLGRMKPEDAADEIEVMAAIYETLKRLAAEEGAKQS